MSSSTIDKKLEIVESIFEIKIVINFESIFEIFCKFRVYFRVYFEFIFEVLFVNFDFLSNGRDEVINRLILQIQCILSFFTQSLNFILKSTFLPPPPSILNVCFFPTSAQSCDIYISTLFVHTPSLPLELILSTG